MEHNVTGEGKQPWQCEMERRYFFSFISGTVITTHWPEVAEDKGFVWFTITGSGIISGRPQRQEFETIVRPCPQSRAERNKCTQDAWVLLCSAGSLHSDSLKPRLGEVPLRSSWVLPSQLTNKLVLRLHWTSLILRWYSVILGYVKLRVKTHQLSLQPRHGSSRNTHWGSNRWIPI